MAWVLPLITVAADLLGKKQKADEFNATQQSAIEQQRQATLANIYSRGKTGGANQFAMSLARQPEAGDNGLGAAIQLASAFGGGGKSGAGGAPATVGGGGGARPEMRGLMDGIEALGGGTNRLAEPKIVAEEWHPIGSDASVGDPDSFKGGLSLFTTASDGSEEDNDESLVKRLSGRFRL